MSKKKTITFFCILFALFFLSYYFFYKKDNKERYNETKFILDTLVSVNVYGFEAENAVKKAFFEIERIQKKFDRYDPNSEISKINKAAGINAVYVSQEVIDVLTYAKEASKKAGAVFDISIGPLVDLWGIGKKGDFIPNSEDVKVAVSLVDDNKVLINKQENTVFLLKQGMSLDLGGVVKGYALDRAIEILKKEGIESALINAGGAVRVIGQRSESKENWVVGVQDPRKSDEIIAKVFMEQYDTLETSGDYQRNFKKNGIVYSHIINKITGIQPREVASVTVLTNNAMLGDILSTSFFILGVEKSLEIIEKNFDCKAIFVKLDGTVVFSEEKLEKLSKIKK